MNEQTPSHIMWTCSCGETLHLFYDMLDLSKPGRWQHGENPEASLPFESLMEQGEQFAGDGADIIIETRYGVSPLVPLIRQIEVSGNWVEQCHARRR